MDTRLNTEPAWRSSSLDRIRNNLDLPWAFVRSAYTGARDRSLFGDLRTYCMFIGYPRSGHSLLGSLLDAHPEAVIAHEADTLRYLQARFTRLQVYSLILANSRRYRDRREIIYDYTVPHQWQGRYVELRVIGDKKGGRSTRRLATSPALLDRLIDSVDVETRFVHVVRNPFDNITTIFEKTMADRGLEAAVEEYLRLCATVDTIRRRLGPAVVLDVRHEALLAEPRDELRTVCHFVGLEAADDYLDDCADILFPSPRRTREHVDWPPALVERVSEAISRYEFLKGYSLD
jgi:hypothetical protein